MEGLLEGVGVFVYFEAARTVPTADADERGVPPMSLINMELIPDAGWFSESNLWATNCCLSLNRRYGGLLTVEERETDLVWGPHQLIDAKLDEFALLSWNRLLIQITEGLLLNERDNGALHAGTGIAGSTHSGPR